MKSPRRLTVYVALALILAGAPSFAQADEPSPLELRLILKRDHYPFEPGFKITSGSAVVLSVELTNKGKQRLSLVGAPEPELELTGPMPASAVQTGGHMFFVSQVTRFTLDPGQSRRISLRQLSFRRDTSQFHLRWTKPGDYRLKAVYQLSLDGEGKGEDLKALPKFTVSSDPVQFVVRAEKVVPYWAATLDDQDLAVRIAALQTLADYARQAPSAASAVVCLLQDASPTVREQAARTLEAIGAPALFAATPLLIEAVKDKEESVRIAAINALATVAAKKKELSPVLVPLLQDDNVKVRAAVARALTQAPFEGGMTDPTRKALLKALRNEANTQVRGLLLISLCHSPDIGVVREVVNALQTNIPELKRAALWTLYQIGPFLTPEAKKTDDALGNPVQDAVTALMECLKEKEHRGNAAYCLMSLGADAAPAVPALIDALNHPDNQAESGIHHSRVHVIQALGGIGPGAKEATRAMAFRLENDADYSVRQYAAETLGKIGPGAVDGVPALRKALRDPMEQVRNEAASALGLIGPAAAAAIPDLLTAVATEKADQSRWRSALSLTRIGMRGQKTAVPMLSKGLDDQDANVVLYCAIALGQIGPDAAAALPALRRVRQERGLPQTKELDDVIRTIGGTVSRTR